MKSPGAPRFADSRIVWDTTEPCRVEVYNRYFREKNFYKNDDFPGVFTLGQTTQEQIERLNELKKNKEKREAECETKRTSLKQILKEKDSLNSEFQSNMWEAVYKQYEKLFPQAFDGFRNSKQKLAQKVLDVAKAKRVPCEISDIQDRARILYAGTLKRCELLPVPISLSITERLMSIEQDQVWNTVVVGNQDLPIAKLIQFMGNADWVNQGRLYLTPNGICPFCQQKTITDTYVKELEDFFSGEYEHQLQLIEMLLNEYQAICKRVDSSLDQLSSFTTAFETGKVDRELLINQLTALRSVSDRNISLMEQKRKEPSRKIEIESTNEMLCDIMKALSDGNNEINIYNNMIDNAIRQKAILTEDVWTYCVAQQQGIIDQYLSSVANKDKAITGISRAISSFEANIREQDNAIVELDASMTSIQPTINRINTLLNSYGFTNFRIAPSQYMKNGYQIQRPDGSLATNTLSEGEETFISFLYFMQLAYGATDEGRVSAKRIMVIDDPISSLDSTILYIVSTQIKKLIAQVIEDKSDVVQVFILTHNVFFHREVSRLDRENNVHRDVAFWMLRKDHDVSTLTSYGDKNPISTSYELLWKELKTPSASNVSIQNTMRRILDQYFHLIGKNTLVASFETPEEQMICDSLLYWINDGSHAIPDDIHVSSYEESIDKYKEMFKRIFQKSGHIAHYNMMMGID